MIKLNKEKIEKIIIGLEAIYNGLKQDLESFVNSYSEHIDKVILKTQEDEKLSYIYGKATLKVVQENKMQFSLDLFFKNNDEKLFNKQIESELMKIDDVLNDEAKSKLINLKEITFDIAPPSAKTGSN